VARGGGPPAEHAGLTYADYCRLPDDGLRYELIEGDLVSEPSPRRAHQEFSGNVFEVLHRHVRERDLGKVYAAPFDVILSTRSVVVPDLVFVARDRLGLVTDRGIEGTPDLIVEIVSPGTARRDRVAKLRLYEQHGVHHYWLADPRTRTLETFELVEGTYRLRASLGGDETLETALFPGLALPLGSLWE
jgi:Uma2 family endonuclease